MDVARARGACMQYQVHLDALTNKAVEGDNCSQLLRWLAEVNARDVTPQDGGGRSAPAPRPSIRRSKWWLSLAPLLLPQTTLATMAGLLTAGLHKYFVSSWSAAGRLMAANCSRSDLPRHFVVAARQVGVEPGPRRRIRLAGGCSSFLSPSLFLSLLNHVGARGFSSLGSRTPSC